MTFVPSGKSTTAAAARTVAIMLRCTSCTPFGGPVVPDV
jgi:hypothetical protein